MRKPVIAGNWKMHLNHEEALALAKASAELASTTDHEIRIYPGYLTLGEISQVTNDSALVVGAQNCHFESQGAYTGEVSPTQLVDAGINHVLIGHSERRSLFGENDELLAKKCLSALSTGLHVTLCVGETLDQREAGNEVAVVTTQLSLLETLSNDQRAALDIAYEPVWAIGTGQVATADQAQSMHSAIRAELDRIGGLSNARILYGGSVKPENCAELAAQDQIDGFLIGGASLKAEHFSKIAKTSVFA